MALFDRASLVQIPSGYKEGKLYNIKPFDQPFEFERGSSATRVNEDGLIERFYNEATNLLLQSNQFDTTWTPSVIDAPTNGFEGYDGSSNAWSLVPTSTNTSCRLAQSISTSGLNTFSVYAKANGGNGLTLRHQDSTTGARFDLSNGTLGIKASSVIKHSIEDVGNGWYRCSVVLNQSITEMRIYVSDVANSYSCTEGNGIYIQDAQLESGYFATPYIETTTEAVTRPNRHDTPRIDYTNGKSLLLEPQRTNLITYSNDFQEWSEQTANILSTNNLSPSGEYNATEVQFQAEGKRIRMNVSTSVESYLSIYVKGVSGETVQLANGNGSQVYTLSGDWDRLVLQAISGVNNFTIRKQGTTAEVVQIYGAQLEQGSYATSYIPTNGQTETRLEDVCEGGGDESTFNASEGTLYCELSALGDDITNRYIGLSDGTDDNRIILGFKNASNTVRVFSQTGAVTQVQIDATYNITNVNKIALTYKSNDVKLWVNGSEAGSKTTYTTVSEFTTLNFDSGSGNSKLKANVKALAYFPEELTDTELQELTTI